MKDNLVGRIVGFEIPHQPAPAHIKPGRKPRLHRTFWGRVIGYSPWTDEVLVESESAEIRGCRAHKIHTVMPVTY